MNQSTRIYPEKIFSEAIQSLRVKKNFAKSKYFNSTNKPPIDMNKILSSKAISVSSVLKIHLVCILFLILYFLNIFNFKPKRNVKQLILIYSLTKEQTVRNGSIKSLFNFLESKSIIEKLNSIVLIEVKRLMWVKKYKMIRTTLDIPLAIFINEIPIKSKLSCWFSMCERYLRVIGLHGSNSDILNIIKEYVFDEVVYSTLDPKKIEKLVTTQSHIAYQPLVFEYRNIDAKRIMIWYSSNSVPIKYKNDRVQRFLINPAVYTSMRIDEHWVWTKEHRAYLSKISPAKVLVKKSLMFYEPEASKNIAKIYDVVIFDVTPHTNAKIVRNSIYTTEEMTKFIQDILSCIELLNIKHNESYRVYLKPKRNISKSHSVDYLNYIKEKVANKEITLIGSNQNLYDLIGDSKLVIGFPFTSPVIIGWELFTPSIFYCSSSLLNYSSKNKKRLFLQDKASLYTYMESELVKVK
jgi:polysaccharide biosynthesis PFTS motif protein